MQRRILIIGTSCSGKSTLSRRISKKLNITHYELDNYFWKENWNHRSKEEFQKIVKNLILNKNWVICGNYSSVRNLILEKSTDIIWLDYSFRTVLFRGVKRALIRGIKKEKVCNGNIETLKKSFFSKDSIIIWVFKTYWKRKVEYNNLFLNVKEKKIYRLKNQNQTDKFLENEL